MAVCRNLKSLSKEEFKEFIESFDIVLTDCDGVLWRETDVINGSPETIAKFKELDKKLFYITNNNTKTRAELVEKCKSHGYGAVTDEILSSSYLAAVYLKQMNFKKKAYVVGSKAITQEFDALGIRHTGVGPDVMEGDELDTLLNLKLDPEVGAVIVGFDKHFSFPKLVKAATYAHDPRIHLIGTNPDVERPSPNQYRFPDAGCFIGAIEAASGRKAVILGKPEAFISQLIRVKYGVQPARTLMIGDNPSTDILLGKRCGFTTLLVMSGITSAEQLKDMKNNPHNSVIPNFYANQLSDVLDCFKL